MKDSCTNKIQQKNDVVNAKLKRIKISYEFRRLRIKFERKQKREQKRKNDTANEYERWYIVKKK